MPLSVGVPMSVGVPLSVGVPMSEVYHCQSFKMRTESSPVLVYFIQCFLFTQLPLVYLPCCLS